MTKKKTQTTIPKPKATKATKATEATKATKPKATKVKTIKPTKTAEASFSYEEPICTTTRDSITLVIKGDAYTLKSSDKNYATVLSMVENAKKLGADKNSVKEAAKIWEAIPSMISKGIAIQNWVKGKFHLKDKELYYGDDLVDEKLHQRMSTMVDSGEDPGPWLKFWEKLQENPSYRSVNQLYNFMDNKGIAIDSEGNILAYKSVRGDWMDHHSGRHKNTIGSLHRMPRNKISDEYNVECHTGFHVGTHSYASTFSAGSTNKLIVCAIHPRDVVSVCTDRGAQKMRVCQYKVVGMYGGKLLSDTTEHEFSASAVIEHEAEVLPEGKAERSSIVATTKFILPEEHAGWEEYNLDNMRKFASRTMHIVGASRLKRDDLKTTIKALLDGKMVS